MEKGRAGFAGAAFAAGGSAGFAPLAISSRKTWLNRKSNCSTCTHATRCSRCTSGRRSFARTAGTRRNGSSAAPLARTARSVKSTAAWSSPGSRGGSRSSPACAANPNSTSGAPSKSTLACPPFSASRSSVHAASATAGSFATGADENDASNASLTKTLGSSTTTSRSLCARKPSSVAFALMAGMESASTSSFRKRTRTADNATSIGVPPTNCFSRNCAANPKSIRGHAARSMPACPRLIATRSTVHAGVAESPPPFAGSSASKPSVTATRGASTTTSRILCRRRSSTDARTFTDASASASAPSARERTLSRATSISFAPTASENSTRNPNPAVGKPRRSTRPLPPVIPRCPIFHGTSSLPPLPPDGSAASNASVTLKRGFSTTISRMKCARISRHENRIFAAGTFKTSDPSLRTSTRTVFKFNSSVPVSATPFADISRPGYVRLNDPTMSRARCRCAHHVAPAAASRRIRTPTAHHRSMRGNRRGLLMPV